MERGFLGDLAAARSEGKAEEIFLGCQIGSGQPFVEIVVVGTGVVGCQELPLERGLLHY
jgi:hypothetical protein